MLFSSVEPDLKFFQTLTAELLKAEADEPVAEPIPAETVTALLDLALQEEGMNEADFEAILKRLVLSTPRTSTKLFFNQLFGGRKGKAILGDLLAVMLNNSMYTYKVAGPQVGVEQSVIAALCDKVGYGEQGTGTFASGGSLSNLMAMIMGRDWKNEQVAQEGVTNKMIAYTSQESHYSVQKNAAFVGVGRAQVRKIPADDFGKMRPDLLEQQIKADLEQGFQPFFVNVTAGTTVLGAFDPIPPVSALCEQYGLWLHVDGAYCGATIFSQQYKHLLEGLERADSFSLNAHKMLGTPLTCSAFLTRHKEQLHASFSNDATYLYQTDGDDFNLGKTSLQCGRRNDALKFWTLWKFVGSKGLEAMVDQEYALAEYARNYVEQHPDYEVYSYKDSVSVCFNYKGIPPKELCTALYEHSEIMVGFGTFRNEEFIRLVTINSSNDKADLQRFFYTMEAFVDRHADTLLPKEPSVTAREH